jgi:hypothetical protein
MNLINNWIKNNDENETLHLSYLNLSELPILPQNLKKLICSYNKISNLNNLPQNLIQPSPIVFENSIPGWGSEPGLGGIVGFVVPMGGLYLINYSIQGVAFLRRNGLDVAGINSALIELNAGDVISLYGLSLSVPLVPTASIIFVKLS